MVILSPIIAWFGTLVGRLSLGAGLLASYFAWLALHDMGVRNRAETATIEKVTKVAKVQNEKGLKARARVDAVDDPAGRLLAQSCRDC